ncbi:MAG: NAD(P)H-dependent glycerol-3-phosphate dehydrogenase [Pseudomonadota bacterium]
MTINQVAVLGAGAWGRALAGQFAGAGPVTLWSHNPSRLEPLAQSGLRYTTDLSEALADADAVVIAIPSSGMAGLIDDMVRVGLANRPLIVAAKGFADDGSGLLSTLFAKALPNCPLAILSGPSFAADLTAGLPTAISLALDPQGEGHQELAPRLLQRLAAPLFRIFLSDDITGGQVGGAAKNVIAIACGIAAGLAYGNNTHAALISRGLAEISRLAEALGGQPHTMMGLAGVGDLVLTCSDRKSRNYSYGLRRGQGMSHDEAVEASAGVIEGIANAANITALATQHDVDMPITGAIDALLHQGQPLDEIIKGLMSRPYKGEGGAWSTIELNAP